MPKPISNPYPSPIPGVTPPKLQCRISPTDHQYFRDLFPTQSVIDAVLSTLFHNLCLDLRDAGLDATNPDHRVWCLDHPTIAILRSLLQRRPVGQHPSGTPSPRHDVGTASGVHQTNGSAAEQRPDPESGTEERIRTQNALYEKALEAERQRNSRTRPAAQPAGVEPDPLAFLRQLGILPKQ